MKVRNPNINAHFLAEDNQETFNSMMAQMVELYNNCPDASRIRFIQAIEDQFKANSHARARSVSGSSGGSGWRDQQKAQFSGRGAKWIKLTDDLHEQVLCQLAGFEEDGDAVEDYRGWVTKAGYSWVRYSGPRGTGESQELAFEVRIGGSRIDHPKHLLKISVIDWENFKEDHSVLGGTPFSAKLED